MHLQFSWGDREVSIISWSIIFFPLSPLSVFQHRSISAMPGGWYAGKNSLQWQRSLLLVFVYLQLSGQRIRTKGKSNCIREATAFARFIPACETNSPVQMIKIIIHQYIGVAGFLISIFDPYQKFLPLFFLSSRSRCNLLWKCWNHWDIGSWKWCEPVQTWSAGTRWDFWLSHSTIMWLL